MLDGPGWTLRFANRAGNPKSAIFQVLNGCGLKNFSMPLMASGTAPFLVILGRSTGRCDGGAPASDVSD
jgi:hypothetical protein